MDTSRRARGLQALLVVTLLVSVGLLLRVTQGKRAAEKNWSDLYALAMNAHAGMYVPIYEGVSSAGDTVRLGDVAPGTRQLLYFFTTTCPYCRASVPTWKRLGDLEVSNRFRENDAGFTKTIRS